MSQEHRNTSPFKIQSKISEDKLLTPGISEYEVSKTNSLGTWEQNAFALNRVMRSFSQIKSILKAQDLLEAKEVQAS